MTRPWGSRWGSVVDSVGRAAAVAGVCPGNLTVAGPQVEIGAGIVPGVMQPWRMYAHKGRTKQ
jgi:hypothetical protein